MFHGVPARRRVGEGKCSVEFLGVPNSAMCQGPHTDCRTNPPRGEHLRATPKGGGLTTAGTPGCSRGMSSSLPTRDDRDLRRGFKAAAATLLLGGAAAAVVVLASIASASDWPQWRGPERTNIS